MNANIIQIPMRYDYNFDLIMEIKGEIGKGKRKKKSLPRKGIKVEKKGETKEQLEGRNEKS